MTCTLRSLDGTNSPTSHSASCGRCGLCAHTSPNNSYKSFVVPVLTYNMVSWGVTKTDLDRRNENHWRQCVYIYYVSRAMQPPNARSTTMSPIQVSNIQRPTAEVAAAGAKCRPATQRTYAAVLRRRRRRP